MDALSHHERVTPYMDQSDIENKATVLATNKSPKRHGFLGETLRFAFITLIIVVPFRYFIAQPFIVSGDSMSPTFENSEYLIVDELSYRFNEPARGDVVIFRYPRDQKKFFIKRIIGLPGETIAIDGKVTTIRVPSGNTFTITEGYAIDRGGFKVETAVTLKDNEYFVLGDNRSASSDSRVWGPLKRSLIIGKPIARLYPLDRLAFTPGKTTLGQEK